MATTSRPPKRVPPKNENDGDRIFEVQTAMKLFGVSRDTLYKWNGKGLPHYKPGKTCFYIYSEAMNWFLNQHMAIKDEKNLQRQRPLSELPKCWPVYPGPSLNEFVDRPSDEKKVEPSEVAD